jgi:hypothetical protein
LDENIDPKVAEQLKRKGIDAVSVRELDLLDEPDLSHLQRATKMQRVLCTHDVDFITLAKTNIDHYGMIYAPKYKATIGGWVRALLDLYAKETAESMAGQFKYISAK